MISCRKNVESPVTNHSRARPGSPRLRCQSVIESTSSAKNVTVPIRWETRKAESRNGEACAWTASSSRASKRSLASPGGPRRSSRALGDRPAQRPGRIAGPRYEEALHVVHLALLRPAPLLLRLHALGDDGDGQAARHVQQLLDEARLERVGLDALHQLAVQLHEVRLEAREQPHRRVARPQVVERHAEAALPGEPQQL